MAGKGVPNQPRAAAASLVIGGEMVMLMDMEEAENMRDLAAIAVTSHVAPGQRHGRLLELGYGLGISAHAIQQLGVREHVLLEANIEVMKSLMASDLATRPGVRPVLGFWQELVPTFADGSFDSIFFDPFPNDDDALSERVVHHIGFMAHAHRLLAPGGVFVYMSGSVDATDFANDREAAFAAGFAPSHIQITARQYMMLDHCAEYPRAT